MAHGSPRKILKDDVLPPETALVSVNGRLETVHARTLGSLLSELGFEGEWLGTAVNSEFVTRDARAAHPIRNGDRIEILSPMQGG